jgi:hypothetical protein
MLNPYYRTYVFLQKLPEINGLISCIIVYAVLPTNIILTVLNYLINHKTITCTLNNIISLYINNQVQLRETKIDDVVIFRTSFPIYLLNKVYSYWNSMTPHACVENYAHVIYSVFLWIFYSIRMCYWDLLD